MKNDFLSKGRSVSDLKAHLVLTTKYRRKVFTGEMINRLHEIFESLLEQQECKLVSFDGEKDHVHLLFQYHPDIHLSKLVNSLKSVSSRKIRVEFGEQLAKTYYKKPVLWNSSYFIASCGGVTISALKKYIEASASLSLNTERLASSGVEMSRGVENQDTPEMIDKDPVQNSTTAHAPL